MPASSDRQKKEAKKRKNSQERVFRAAIAILARQGYHNTRITDIAHHAGVAYGLVYHYFGSKANILDVILDEVGVRFNDRLDRISKEDLPVREKLGRISDYMFDSYLANEDMIHLLVNEVVHGPGSERGGQILSGWIRKIANIINEESDDRGPFLESQVLALSFFGSVQMLLAALVAGYYDRGSAKKSVVVRSLKSQVRALLERLRPAPPG